MRPRLLQVSIFSRDGDNFPYVLNDACPSMEGVQPRVLEVEFLRLNDLRVLVVHVQSAILYHPLLQQSGYCLLRHRSEVSVRPSVRVHEGDVCEDGIIQHLWIRIIEFERQGSERLLDRPSRLSLRSVIFHNHPR